MKYIDGFRDPDAARYLKREIGALAKRLAAAERTVRLMEVCGSHTMAIARYGIRQVLPENVRLLSGPGCPVCVTDAAYIDAAIALAEQGHTIATFGDMLKVPGSGRTLADARSVGGRVKVCYSPMDAIGEAEENPSREVIFLAIGFETTIPPVTAVVKAANAKGLSNISFLTAFKLVPPALEALTTDPEVKVDGFICPAHVSAIIGSDAYVPFVEKHEVPCVIAGFEPLDILMGIKGLLEQLLSGEPELVNQYSRVVKKEGNKAALALMDAHLEPADASWRGIGTIPSSGLKLRPQLRRYDAAEKFGVRLEGGTPDSRCRCGDVLKGKLLPPECPLFGKACNTLRPVGPCMVSAEGSCAAYYKYSR